MQASSTLHADEQVQAVAERIRRAAESATPLCIKGGGSKDFYGQASAGEPLSTLGLAGVVSYEPSELVVTARAGTPLVELEQMLAHQGQCLPFEPPRFAAGGPSLSTVGGMVASGLSGPARASVGSVRDHVLGLHMLNGRGQLLVFGGQVMKNVAGYDVSRLMAGSLGTLGLITEVSLKVMPVAPAEATLLFEMPQAQALDTLARWGGQPLPLNASAWMRPAGSSSGFLYLRLRGAQAAVESACRTLGGQLMDAADALSHWQGVRDQTHAFFAHPPAPDACLWRLSVAQTAPSLNVPGLDSDASFIEWHGGQRWLWAVASHVPALRAAAAAGAGHATLFRASPASPQADRAVGVFQPLEAPLARIHRELKAQFDPAGVLNRQRLYQDF